MPCKPEPLPRHLYPQDTLMIGPWATALKVCLTHEDTLQKYRQETGDTFEPATRAIDQMVDEQTGADREFLIRFVEWFNKTVWGSLDVKAGE